MLIVTLTLCQRLLSKGTGPHCCVSTSGRCIKRCSRSASLAYEQNRSPSVKQRGRQSSKTCSKSVDAAATAKTPHQLNQAQPLTLI